MSLGEGSRRHGGQPLMRCEQLHEALEHFAVIGEVGFLQHHGCRCLDHLFGVAGLVIVGCGGKGDEKSRFARGGKFGDSGGSAARHDEISLGEACGHVVQKSADLPSEGSAPLFL